MTCALTGSETNLAAYWNFDEGAVTDLTGHGHTGTLAGNASVVSITGGDAVHAGCNPVEFASVSLTLDRLPLMSISGRMGVNLRVDASTNLLDWITLINLPNPQGIVQFMDPAATNFSRRFYRAVAP